jgi:hypothetical protein
MTNATNYAVAATIGPRFTVAGIMLGILAGWMSANHDDAPFGPIAAVAVVAVMSLAWGLARLRIAPDESAAGMAHRSGVLALLGAVVLAGVGVWWTVALKLAGLGEILGLELFAVVSAVAGWQYLNADSQADGWSRVRSSLGAIGGIFFLIGAASLAAAMYLTMTKFEGTEARMSSELIPETIGFLLGGFVLFFGGLYLFNVRAAAPDAEALKWNFLTIGTALGGVIAFVSMARAIMWVPDWFRSGIAVTFSGPESWHFWAVAYGFLIGLGLVLASVGSAFSRTGTSAGLRQSYYGIGDIFSAGLLLIGLATCVFMVHLQAPYTLSWSKTRGISDLSPSTKNLLSGLDRKVTVYALMNSGNPIYDDLIHFLANCKVVSPRFDYEIINPERSPEKYNPLATRFKEIDVFNPLEGRDRLGRGVLVVYGTLPEDVKEPVPHAFIPSKQLFDEKGDPGKPMFVLKAEVEIMKELAFLTNKSEKRKIYFLQGDEELDIFSTEEPSLRTNTSVSLERFGGAKLAEKLKTDRFEVAAVTYSLTAADDKGDKKKDIVRLGGVGPGAKTDLPDDCTILIIAGPSSPVPQTALDALERYMDRGGRLIVFLDVFTDRAFTKWTDTGLEGFLKKYGVDAPQEMVFRFPQQRDLMAFGNNGRNPIMVMVESPANPKTLLAKQFQDSPQFYWSVRPIKPAMSAKYQVEPLRVVSASKFLIWPDGNARGYGDTLRYSFEMVQTRKVLEMQARENIPVAVTVAESAGAKPRMVVFGDVEFITNFDIGGDDPTNYDMARSAIEWMSERGFIGPSPKETSTFSLSPATDRASMVWGALWTLLVAIVILGGGVWLIRRQ